MAFVQFWLVHVASTDRSGVNLSASSYLLTNLFSILAKKVFTLGLYGCQIIISTPINSFFTSLILLAFE